MNEFFGSLLEIELRVRKLEFAQTRRELDDLVRRIERLERATGMDGRSHPEEPESR